MKNGKKFVQEKYFSILTKCLQNQLIQTVATDLDKKIKIEGKISLANMTVPSIKIKVFLSNFHEFKKNCNPKKNENKKK